MGSTLCLSSRPNESIGAPRWIAAIAIEIGPLWEQQRIDRIVSRPRSRAIGPLHHHSRRQ
jgi:hypothetical protein